MYCLPAIIPGMAAFLRNAMGSTAVSFAVALPGVLAAMGVASDYAIFNMKLEALQAAADQAAIAGAKEFALAKSTSSSIKGASESYALASLEQADGSILADVAVDKVEYSVTVKLTETWTPFFGHYIGMKITPVSAKATATLAGSSNICVLTLDTSSTKALHMDKQAKMIAKRCGVYSNSTHSQGIRLDQNSTLEAALICSAGGVKAQSSAVSPAPTTDCPVVEDPLGARVEPTVGACDFNKTVVSTGTRTLSPGHYCKGLKIIGDAKVSFEPGEYIISGDKFRVADTASIKGEHVGFYLSGAATTIDFVGNSTVALTGAKSGKLAGFLFFEDRSAPIGRTHRINSANANELTGTIYLPRGRLRIDPNSSVAEDSAFTAIIVNTLEIDEGPALVLNTDYGATDVPVPNGIQSTSQVFLTE